MLKLADKPSCLGGGDHVIKQNSELVFLPKCTVEVRVLLLQHIIISTGSIPNIKT